MNNLVIGASSGIGEAIVKTIGGVAVARREEKLKQFNEYEVFDVSNLNGIESFMKNLVKKYGRFDNLIFCAGTQNIKSLRTITVDEILEIFNVNIIAAILFAKSFALKRICTYNSSNIIFISSIAALKPEAGILPYSATKGALNNFIKGAAKELAPIKVNGVAPGFLKTEMTKKFDFIYSEEFINNVEKKSPLGLAEVNDIVETVKFLINSKHITGEIIRVDGGSIL